MFTCEGNANSNFILAVLFVDYIWFNDLAKNWQKPKLCIFGNLKHGKNWQKNWGGYIL